MSVILETKQLCKFYGAGENQVKAVNQVDIQIEQGEFVAIVGKSGSGKSTLLHMLGGLDTPTKGSVTLAGKDLYRMKEDALAVFRRRKIGFVFQAFNLVSSVNVWENIVLPLGLDGRKVDEAYVNDIIATLGIENRIYNLPNQLSGGQQQRVAIARALVNRPEIIFADEPTGSVALVQHYPKIIPVMLLSRSTRISDMTERQSVRFSSRVRESYMLLKSACNILSTAEKSGGVSSGASSGICCRAAVYIW